MRTNKITNRHFIRHPSDIPIEVLFSKPSSKSSGKKEKLKNISYGGLSFSSHQPMRAGDTLIVRISISKPEFVAEGTVSWCMPQDDEYLIGVEFLKQDDAFMARMVEQICYIEQYKNEVLKAEGRQMDSTQAALEWIQKFASKFPNPDSK